MAEQFRSSALRICYHNVPPTQSFCFVFIATAHRNICFFSFRNSPKVEVDDEVSDVEVPEAEEDRRLRRRSWSKLARPRVPFISRIVIEAPTYKFEKEVKASMRYWLINKTHTQRRVTRTTTDNWIGYDFVISNFRIRWQLLFCTFLNDLKTNESTKLPIFVLWVNPISVSVWLKLRWMGQID